MTHLKHYFLAWVCVLAGLTLSSCDKKEEFIEALSESEAVELIEASLESGIVSNLEDLTAELLGAIASGEFCDSSYTETVEKNYEGNQVIVSYTSDFSYEFTCNNFNIPETATYSSTTASVYSSPRLGSDNDAVFAGDASGLEYVEPSLVFAGEYQEESLHELAGDDPKNVSSVLLMDFLSLNMSKQSLEIESGTSTFTFSGSTQGESFQYEGTLIFHGGNTATLTLNGVEYELSWN